MILPLVVSVLAGLAIVWNLMRVVTLQVTLSVFVVSAVGMFLFMTRFPKSLGAPKFATALFGASSLLQKTVNLHWMEGADWTQALREGYIHAVIAAALAWLLFKAWDRLSWAFEGRRSS